MMRHILRYFKALTFATLTMVLAIGAQAAEKNTDCITFTSKGAFSLNANGKGWDGTLYWSTDRLNWTEWTWAATTPLAAAQTGGTGAYNLYVRGDADNTKITEKNANRWVLTTNGVDTVACGGNIETLRGATGDGPSPTRMAAKCYSYMFSGCKALTAAPALPATSLANNCYAYMFSSCVALAEAPALPAMTLEVCCYIGMFYQCTSLTMMPELPATTLADCCYAYMFDSCTALEVNADAPGKEWKIPVTSTTALDWNLDMFSGIKPGSTVPAFPELNTTYYTPNYLTFTAQESNSTVTFKYSSGTNVKYSTNGGLSWNDCPSGTKITLANIGDRVSFKGKSVVTDGSNRFSMTGKVAASGDVTSLTNETGGDATLTANCYYRMFYNCTALTEPPALSAMAMAESCYNNMFYGCTALTAVPVLPATTLADGCYSGMFLGCSSLTNAPDLSATTLTNNCYKQMFKNCTSLTNAPALSSMAMAESCYNQMFYGCTSLTAAPVLPATELAASCYYDMFNGCKALTAAPALPATELAASCYYNMFKGCTSLTSAPALSATLLSERCCQQMFQNCTSLTSVPALPATTLANYCYYNMFNGCTSLIVNDFAPGKEWKISAEEPTSATSWGKYMFKGTGGNVTGEPALNTTYYIASVRTTVTPQAVAHTTFKVYTNDTVEVAAPYEVTWGATVKVTYTADAGYAFAGGTTEQSATFAAESDPTLVPEAQVPAEPAMPPPVADVTAQQRYPWNGMVDISYTATGVAAMAKAKGMEPSLKVLAIDRSTTPWTTNVADAAALFVGPLAVEALTDAGATADGAHQIVWDMNAQGLTFASTNIVFTVLGEAKKPLGGVQLWADGPYFAECNVGATKPEESGYYFWWGDTVGYKRNSTGDGWVSSKDGTTSFSFLIENCPTYNKAPDALKTSGYLDDANSLAAKYDAATAHLGAPWRMPTDAELQTLLNKCTTTWTNNWNGTGVNGQLVTGKGDYAMKSIFLPAAGLGNGSDHYRDGEHGRYWSSTPKSNDYDAQCLHFASTVYRDYYVRALGQSVRPLRIASGGGLSSSATETLGGEESAQVRVDLATGTRIAAATETLTYSSAWFGGDSVALAANGTTLDGADALTGAGTFVWTPSGVGTVELTHTVVTSGVPVVLTAVFELPRTPILAQPTEVDHATLAVYTNGVLSSEVETGKWAAWSNETAVVVYTADPGYVFAGDATTITNSLDTTKNPATADVPAAPFFVVQVGDDAWAHVDGGLCTVTGKGDMWSASEWTAGNPLADVRTNIRAVVVADGVTGIGDWAFQKFYALTNVACASSVTNVGVGAFSRCLGIEAMAFAGEKPTLGAKAFTVRAGICMGKEGPVVYPIPKVTYGGVEPTLYGKTALTNEQWEAVTPANKDTFRFFTYEEP